MKSDAMIQADVTAELAWDQSVEDHAAVGVAVHDGVVTLSGQVKSYLQKHAIERAARRVAGVRGIAVDLEVRLPSDSIRTDADMANAALEALHWHSLVPHDTVRVEVDNGLVTLSGELEWPYQRASAEQCVRSLTGVRDVVNQIQLRPRANATAIASGIAAAFSRHAAREARHIDVQVDGGVVTLRGRVDTMQAHEAAIGTAWSAKGVTRVIDHLEVGP